MKKTNPTRYSSAVGDIWVMATFKIKYCHKLFDNLGIRELTEALFSQAFERYGVMCRKIAFDSDHVHMILDMGLYSKIELAKKLKGYVAKGIFKFMPWLKNNKWGGGYFWNSGFWNPAYDIRSINDMDFYNRYLDKQRYSGTGQTMLLAF